MRVRRHDEVRLTLPLDRRFLRLALLAASDLARQAGLEADAAAGAAQDVEALWREAPPGATVVLTYRVGPDGLVVDSEVSP